MTANLEILNAVKTESIQDAANAVARVLRDLSNLLKQSQIRLNMWLNGKKRTVTKLMLSVDVGMKITWSMQGNFLLNLLRNIYQRSRDARNEIKDLLIGRRKILKSGEFTIEQCMQSTQVSLFGQINALNAPKNVNHTLITRITQSLWMSFGSVLNAISTYIINQNITVREQARKLRKEMRCSELLTKAVEICRNDVSPRNGVNSKWQAGGKSRFIYLPPGYNNDPFLNEADLKSSLIVLNTLNYIKDNKVQAAERWAA